MVWQASDKRILFSSLGEPLVYDLDSDTPGMFNVIVTGVDRSYEGELPQHSGTTITFLTDLLMKPRVKVRVRDTDCIIKTFESGRDGLFTVRCSPY